MKSTGNLVESTRAQTAVGPPKKRCALTRRAQGVAKYYAQTQNDLARRMRNSLWGWGK